MLSGYQMRRTLFSLVLAFSLWMLVNLSWSANPSGPGWVAPVVAAQPQDTADPLLEHRHNMLLLLRYSGVEGLLMGMNGRLNRELSYLYDRQHPAYEDLRPVSREQLSNHAIYPDFIKLLLERIDPKHTRQLLRLFQQDILTKMSHHERAASDYQHRQVYLSYQARVKESPPKDQRIQLMLRLDEAAHLSRLNQLLWWEMAKSIELLALQQVGRSKKTKASAQGSAAGPSIELTEAGLDKLLQQRQQQQYQHIEQEVLAFFLFAYRHVMDPELNDYIDFYRDPTVQTYLKILSQTLADFFKQKRKQLVKELRP